MQCGNCKATIEEQSKFCSQCGEKVSLRCEKCGSGLDSKDRFCRECGCKISSDKEIRFMPGDYITFGQFENEKLIWVVLEVDEENNPLLWSQKAICNLKFDVYKENKLGEKTSAGVWKTCELRKWLNNKGFNAYTISDIEEGDSLNKEIRHGFLSELNFSKDQMSLIKETTHKVFLNSWLATNSESGKKEQLLKDIVDMESNEQNIEKWAQYDFSNAMGYEVKDKVFLPSIDYLLKLYNSEKHKLVFNNKMSLDEEYLCWLDTPAEYSECVLTIQETGNIHIMDSMTEQGLRPILQLDKRKLDKIEGRGTLEMPYIIK